MLASGRKEEEKAVAFVRCSENISFPHPSSSSLSSGKGIKAGEEEREREREREASMVQWRLGSA